MPRRTLAKRESFCVCLSLGVTGFIRSSQVNAVLLTRKSQEFVLNSEWKYSKCGRYLRAESSKGKLVDYGSRFGRCGDGDKRGICMSLQVVLDKVVAARDRGALVVFASHR